MARANEPRTHVVIRLYVCERYADAWASGSMHPVDRKRILERLVEVFEQAVAEESFDDEAPHDLVTTALGLGRWRKG